MNHPQIVVVSGHAGAIGSALCQVFRSQGCFVVGVDRRPSAGTADREIIADLSQASLRGVIAEIRAALAGRPLHALVNNAAHQVNKPVEALQIADWRETLAVNLLAPWQLIRGLLDLLELGGGSVINITSIHGKLTKPGFAAYATSKAALEGLTRSLAVELGGRIRVNAIAPAAIDTPLLKSGFVSDPSALAALAAMHPAGRTGRPEEVAQAAAFLASGQAAFITGTVLGLDGGIAARLHDPT
jgi:NAD(P)-dependent dehydrogenase (short-subunit alcohol dehydrogenase family)